MSKSPLFGILVGMKKIFLALTLGFLMLSPLAHAADPSVPERSAKIAQQNAMKAQKDMTTVCNNALKKTKSHQESLAYQIDVFDNIALGESLLQTPTWAEAEKHFRMVSADANRAIGLCHGTQQLKLSTKNYDTALTENVIMRVGKGLQYQNETRLSTIFRGELLRMINRILGGLAIFFIVLIGMKYIMSMGNDEKLSKYKVQLAWLALGLAVISLAEFAGFELLDPSGGNDILSGNTQSKLYEKAMTIVRFFEYAAGAFMLINAILAGYHLIMSGEKEETISQEKKFLQSLLMGSAMILMAEIIVRVLSFQDSPERTAELLVMEVAGIINFALSFIAILAMSMLVLASLYYVISFGDEEQTTRAKRMIKTSLIGVIIASASYVLIRFLINS